MIPFVSPPEGVIPGMANWYASVCTQCSAGCGIHVKVLEGRAKKIEGNPSHPVSQGKLCARGQAGLQSLYNPDRLTSPMLKENGKFKKVSWSSAENILAEKLKDLLGKNLGDRMVFITEPLRSSLGKLVSDFAGRFGSDNIISYEYFSDESLAQANEICFGYKEVPHYDIENSRYVLSIGTDFLDTWTSPVKHSVSYGKMRDKSMGIEGDRGWLTQFESRLSLTGASADEWSPIKPETEGLLALSIAHVIVKENLSSVKELGEWQKFLSEYTPEKVSSISGLSKEKIEEVARNFAKTKPSVAIVGSFASNGKNGLANSIAGNVLNHLVGAVNQNGGVKFPQSSSLASSIPANASYSKLKNLSDKMSGGGIEVALVYNANPLFYMPAASNFQENFKKVPFIVSFSSFLDDTTSEANLILPDSNYLESWSDYIPLVDNGRKTVGLIQPIVNKLYDTKQVGDTLISVAKKVGGSLSSKINWPDYLSFLKSSWQTIYTEAKGKGNFKKFWEKSLQNGGWWETQESTKPVKQLPKPSTLPKPSFGEEESTEHNFHLYPYPSHGLYDGKGANLPWMQQLPEPLVTGTWGTWAEINPETAKELNVSEGGYLEIESEAGKISLPAFVFPAIEPETIAIPVGQGHKEYGRYAKNRGVNPLSIINDSTIENSEHLAWCATKVKVSKGDMSMAIAKTDPGSVLPGIENGVRELDRELVQWISPKEAEESKKLKLRKQLKPIEAIADLEKFKEPTTPPIPIIGLKPRRYPHKYRWGMVIDLDKCTGCSACMVACYAENNMPIVDEVEMRKFRHKNWIRIDRYWEGEYPKVRAKMLPVNCYQCGKAPCEPACLVYAAFRTSDGLNGQVYQRCVGTRYCNVACPYRSRLFNWSIPKWPKPLDQQLNPELSVRPSGVTDKCTFCANRIRAAKERALDENRKVKDGEIQTACAQTCPSGAIVFGDLLDHNSMVSKLSTDPRRYRVLEELGTEPGVIFLKAVREGAEEKKPGEEHGGEKEEA